MLNTRVNNLYSVVQNKLCIVQLCTVIVRINSHSDLFGNRQSMFVSASSPLVRVPPGFDGIVTVPSVVAVVGTDCNLKHASIARFF